MADKKMEAQISVEFEEATSRQSLNSGETINTLWGKVKRWLSDLKSVCFSGSYNDLSDRPTTATTDTDGLMSASDKSKLDGADDTYALKSIYSDSTLNLGRAVNSEVGEYSVVIGRGSSATMHGAVAEGMSNTASGYYSHAEGSATTASGYNSHSEGWFTTASGFHSHAGGRFSKAEGWASFAHGHYVNAISGSDKNAGHAAFGMYNYATTNTLFSIGDGTADDARHNAFEITTTGGKLHDKDIATTDMSLPANGGNADTLGNKHASDFANSYNDDLMKFLNGQSGDIRTLVQQLPLGGYIFNTTRSELSGITFPIYGDGIMSWGACKYSANDLRYGILIIRPMLSAGYTYICSVYNNSAYTDWEQISTTPIKSTTFSGTTGNSGDIALWSTSEKKIPMYIEIADCYAIPFLSSSGGGQYMAHAFDSNGDRSNTAVSGTVYYTEI